MSFRPIFYGALALLLCCAVTLAPEARATSTDGYHKILVIPVVAQSATFHTSFSIHNPPTNSATAAVTVDFYQGNIDCSTSCTPGGVPAHIDCGFHVVPPGQALRFPNLQSLCPGAANGNGWVLVNEVSTMVGTSANAVPINVFTRVDNFSNTAGFEIESYPAHTFTGAPQFVHGLSRAIGVGGTPIQTNCFVGALNEATTVTLTLVNGDTGGVLGTPITVGLAPNQLVRLLDIFGATAGNYSNGVVQFTTTPIGSSPQKYPAVVAFCTLQNNSSFDADFRIAKARPVFDNSAQRLWVENADEAGANFKVGTFPNERSRHVVYFKHPDVIQCDLLNVDTVNLPPAGLQMLIYTPEGVLAFSGTSSPDIYTGEKGQHGAPGVLGLNGKWLIDVRASSSAANDALYSLRCRSGSGHTDYEWVGRNLPH